MAGAGRKLTPTTRALRSSGKESYAHLLLGGAHPRGSAPADEGALLRGPLRMLRGRTERLSLGILCNAWGKATVRVSLRVSFRASSAVSLEFF